MRNNFLSGLLVCLFVSISLSVAVAQSESGQKATPQEIFEQRIMPIFRSPKPSSCVQCHLSSVDLKNYILPTQEKTFASLRDQGLIDLEHPDKSKILTLIGMGEKDLDKGARLIHEQTRQAEYVAFANWIEACCNDQKIRDLPKLSLADRARPESPDEVIRHARKSRLVDSFERNIWTQRMRCFPCHTPNEIDPNNPQQQAAVKTRKNLEEKFGKDFLPRLNIFRETPEETLAYLIERSRNPEEGDLPLLNLDDPRNSLLLLKPLSKLPKKKENGEFEAPSSATPVSHMGGLKMHPDDQSYKSFVAWIQDYANVVQGKYVSVEDLPADNWEGTQKVIKLSSAPEEWKVGVPVQLFLHAWSEEDSSWSPEPIAFTQGTVTPRRLVNGALFQLNPKNASGDQTEIEDPLGGGTYLVKVFVDSHGKLTDDPSLLLGGEDFVGQTELKKSRWRDGFKNAPMVSSAKLIVP